MIRTLAVPTFALAALLALPGPADACTGSLPWAKVLQARSVVVGTVIAARGGPYEPDVRIRVDAVLKGHLVQEVRLQRVRGSSCGDFIYAERGTRMILALGIPFHEFLPPDEPFVAAWWAQSPSGELSASADLAEPERLPRSLNEVVDLLRADLPDTATASIRATETGPFWLLTVSFFAAYAAALSAGHRAHRRASRSSNRWRTAGHSSRRIE